MPLRQIIPSIVDLDMGGGCIRIATAGQGTPIVMLHGWTLDHRSWAPQLPLSKQARLIMPDRRGFGASTAPPDLSCEWQDVDLIAGPEPFVLVGMSQGASVALDVARRRPDRVKALILAGAPLHGVVANDDDETPIPRTRYATMIRAGQLAAVKADWARSPLVRTKAIGWPLLSAMLNDYDGRDLLGPTTGITISADDIAALPMPVLSITGARDTRWRRQVSAFIGNTAPQGRMVSIDHAGHLCNIDHPARFNAVLASFVTEIPSTSIH